MFQWLYYYYFLSRNNQNFFYLRNQLHACKIFINYFLLIRFTQQYNLIFTYIYIFKYFLTTRFIIFHSSCRTYSYVIKISIFDQFEIKNIKKFCKNTIFNQKNFFKKFSFGISWTNNIKYGESSVLQNTLSFIGYNTLFFVNLINNEREYPVYMHTYNSWSNSVLQIFMSLMTQITQIYQTSTNSLIFKLDDCLMYCEDCCLNWRFGVQTHRHAVRKFASFYIFGRTRIIKTTTTLFATWLNQWRPYILTQQITHITLYASISCLFCWQSTTFYLLCLHFFKFTINGIFIENFFTSLIVGDCLKFSCIYFLYYFFSLQYWRQNVLINNYLPIISRVEKQLVQHHVNLPFIFFFTQSRTKFNHNSLLFNIFNSFYYLHAYNNFFLSPHKYFLNLLKSQSQFFLFTEILVTKAVLLHEIVHLPTLQFSNLKNFFMQCLIFCAKFMNQIILQYRKCLIQYFFFNFRSNNKIWLKCINSKYMKYINYFFLFYQKFFILSHKNKFNSLIFYKKISIFNIYAQNTYRYVFCNAFKCIVIDINEMNLKIYNASHRCKLKITSTITLQTLFKSNQFSQIINTDLYLMRMKHILNQTVIPCISEINLFLCIFFLQRFFYFKLNSKIRNCTNDLILHRTQYANLFAAALQLIYRGHASISHVNQQTKMIISSTNKEILFFCFKNLSIGTSIESCLYSHQHAYQFNFSSIKYYFIKNNNFLTNFFNYIFAAQWFTPLNQILFAQRNKNSMIEFFDKITSISTFFAHIHTRWLFLQCQQLQSVYSFNTKMTRLTQFVAYQTSTRLNSCPQFFLQRDTIFTTNINNSNFTDNITTNQLKENMNELHQFFNEYNLLSFDLTYPDNQSSLSSTNTHEDFIESKTEFSSTVNDNLSNVTNLQPTEIQMKTFHNNNSTFNEAKEIANTHLKIEKTQAPIYLQSTTYATTHRAYFSNMIPSLATVERYLSFEIDWFVGQIFYINRHQIITVQMLLQHIAPYRCTSQLNWKYL